MRKIPKTLAMPPDLLEELERLADERNSGGTFYYPRCTWADIARAAMRDYIDSRRKAKQPSAPKKKAKKARGKA